METAWLAAALVAAAALGGFVGTVLVPWLHLLRLPPFEHRVAFTVLQVLRELQREAEETGE